MDVTWKNTYARSALNYRRCINLTVYSFPTPLAMDSFLHAKSRIHAIFLSSSTSSNPTFFIFSINSSLSPFHALHIRIIILSAWELLYYNKPYIGWNFSSTCALSSALTLLTLKVGAGVQGYIASKHTRSCTVSIKTAAWCNAQHWYTHIPRIHYKLTDHCESLNKLLLQ